MVSTPLLVNTRQVSGAFGDSYDECEHGHCPKNRNNREDKWQPGYTRMQLYDQYPPVS